MSINTYSAADVLLVFGGYPLVEWDQVALKFDANFSNLIQGIRGKNTRVVNKSKSATIDIVCPTTSQSNDVLRQIVMADQATGGSGRLSLMLKDLSSGFVFESSEAYITRFADAEYGVDIGQRRWTIQCLHSQVSAAQESGNYIDKAKNLIKKFV